MWQCHIWLAMAEFTAKHVGRSGQGAHLFQAFQHCSKCNNHPRRRTTYHSIIINNNRFVVCPVPMKAKNVGTIQMLMKKALNETQTLRAGCSKAEPKVFAPPQTPFPGARDGQNLISWRRSLPLLINPVWWGSMHAISSYCGNRPTHKHTDRTDYNTLRRSLARSVTKHRQRELNS